MCLEVKSNFEYAVLQYYSFEAKSTEIIRDQWPLLLFLF